jgi:hypothetical protein
MSNTTAKMVPVKTRVAWMRWDNARRKNIISHPTVWIVVEHDGYERSFDTKREALEWIAQYERKAGAFAS